MNRRSGIGFAFLALGLSGPCLGVEGQRAVVIQAGQMFDGGTLQADSDTLTIPIPGLPTGTYLVRVLIDGAESPLVPVAPTIRI